VGETLRTWCASYLQCIDCGNMWTERLPLEERNETTGTEHPRRRRSDGPEMGA
jgi:hypothetical protein